MRTFATTLVLFIISFGMPMTVFALAANGATCTLHSDCESGNCVPGVLDTPSTCEAAVTTPVNTGGTYTSSGGTYTDGGNGSSGVRLINPLRSGTSVESFLGNILSFVVRIGGIVVVLMMVFVGFKFVTAQGNEAKITEAKNMLLWTVIGALVLLGAIAIKDGIVATVQSLGG